MSENVDNQIFVIGIGGTGMRCLESLIHFCAAGRFSDKKIHMLALDTDLHNGNFQRVDELVHLYRALKDGKNPLQGTMFGAQIEFYKYSPDYSTNKTKTFNKMLQQSRMEDEDSELAKLFFTENVREFELIEGYRAQTHLGSMLMYNAIVDAAKNHTNSDNESLCRFLEKLGDTNGEMKKCFVMGSVFGGTGASSIPVVPRAFEAAWKQLKDSTKNLDHVSWGASLLTAYFTFNNPSKEELQSKKVIADAGNFKINTQVALAYYFKDPAVKNSYKQFYILGNPEDPADFRKEGEIKTDVGGATQKNPAHYLEMYATTAAEKFFSSKIDPAREPQYFYRVMNKMSVPDAYIDFSDVVEGADECNDFALNLLTLKILSTDTKDDKIFSPDSVKKNAFPADIAWLWDSKDLQDYLAMYKAWIEQLWNSANGQNHLFFKQEAFGKKGAAFFKDDMNDLFLPQLSSNGYFKGKSYKKSGLISKTAWDPFTEQCQKWTAEPGLAKDLPEMSPALKFVSVVRSVFKQMYQF